MDLFTTFFNIDVLIQAAPLLLKGFWLTVQLGAVSLVISLALGLLLVLVRLYAPTPLRWLSICYIDLFRAVPLLVLLILVYYALPFVGIRLSSFWAAAAALSAVASAYMAETFRAGIEAVPTPYSPWGLRVNGKPELNRAEAQSKARIVLNARR